MVHKEKPICGKEAQEMEDQYSHLIGRHNVLCKVEEAFSENTTAAEFLEKAREEVLDSGNYSYASILEIAIKEMGYEINAYENETEKTTDFDMLKRENHMLQSENKRLKEIIRNAHEFLSNGVGKQ